MPTQNPETHDDRLAILIALVVMLATLATLTSRMVWGV
jgi:hypothetical protein